MTPDVLSTLPGPPPVPMLGWRANALQFLSDPIKYMDALPSKNGVVPFVARGCPPILLKGAGQSVFAMGAACNKAVLGDMANYHSEAIPGPNGSFQKITAGLFNMNGSKHTQQRRLMVPAFHKQRLASYRDAMVDCTEQMLKGWKPGQTLDILKEFQCLTFAIANTCLFGIHGDDSDAAHSLGSRLLEAITLAMSPLTLTTPNLPGTPCRRLVQLSARLEVDMRALIARKRLVTSDESDVLATLLRAHDEDGGKMSDDELMGQMFLLFFAGHDTTRNTLAWTMFLLATHPKIYDALADEVTGLLKGSAPTIEQISALPLLDRVVKESLRLFPSAPFTMRSSQRATELNGVSLPAGSEVVLSYYHTHRNPDIFPDPQHFRPERWEGLNPSAFEYLPFGAGARQCIGMGFASMEVRIVLAMVVQQFRLSFPANTRIDRQTRIVLSPSPGLPMQIHGRTELPVANTPIRGNVRSMVVLPE